MKHASHKKYDKEAKREYVDYITRHLPQAKRRALVKSAIDIDGVAVVQTAGDAENVGAEDAAGANDENIQEGGVGPERDQGEAAADEPRQEYSVDGNVQIW